MEQETQEQSASQEETRRDVRVVTPSQGDVLGTSPTSEVPCPGGAASMPVSHVYAIGRIEARFPRILQMTDNAGATDDHRPLNYLAMRYPGIYAKAAEEFARDFSLTGVDVLPSP